MKLKTLSILTALFLAKSITTFAVPPTTANDPTTGFTVSLGVSVEPKKVPLNRPATLTILLAWQGALDSVLVGEVEEPILSNLEITGTSTSNKVIGTQAGPQSIKEISYTLKPKSLGMAYIDSVRVNYEDRKAGVVHQVKTQRLSVEVVNPVPEKRSGPRLWIWFLLIACFLAGAAGGVALFFKSRKRKPQDSVPVQRPTEENYLQSLKEKVDLHGENRGEAFAALAKLFRQYLSEKFDIAALEATTKELLAALRGSGVEENLLRKCEAFFEKADVYKFSGRKVSQAEIEEAYTTVESVFESKLAEERLRLQQIQEEALRQEKDRGNWLKKVFTIRKTKNT